MISHACGTTLGKIVYPYVCDNSPNDIMILQQNNTPTDTNIIYNNRGNVKVPICDINIGNVSN